MTTSVGRPAVAVYLPSSETEPVARELREGGFDPILVHDVQELAAVLAARRDIVVGVVDLETDPDAGLDAWSLLGLVATTATST
jgi:hypothetical protein